MNNKTVYDELLSYKISKEDAKHIAESFILLQSSNVKILLADLIKIFYKKVELAPFCKALVLAKEKNIKIPLQKLIKSELIREDLQGMTDGLIYAAENKLDTDFDDLLYFAKNKTKLTELLKTFATLNTADPSILISDLKNSNFFLYSPKELKESILQILKADKTISAREIIFSEILPSKINEVVRLYGITKKYKTKISAGELLQLHNDGINIKSLIEAVNLSEKNNLKVSFKDIVQYELSESTATEIINHALVPVNKQLKPLTGVTKDGTEVVVKFTVSTLSDLKYYSKAANFAFFISKIKQNAAAEISKYENYNAVNSHLPQISEKIKADFAKMKNAFILVDITINDTDIGRNIETENEIKRLNAEQIIAEKKAQILEAELRAKKAKEALAGHSKKKENKHHNHH